MREIHGQDFRMLADPHIAERIESVSVTNCSFFACHFGETARYPNVRRRIQRVRLVDCTFTNNSGIGPAIVEDVDVINCDTRGVCFALGAAFRHVKFDGRCGKLIIAGPTKHVARDAFIKANEEFYRTVDWALDISKAEFRELEIYGVPAALIVRDPESQVVVDRETVMKRRKVWEALDLQGTPWKLVLSNFLEMGFNDQVLIAPRRRRNFALWRGGLERLCDADVATR